MSNINPEANLIHAKQDRVAHYEQTFKAVEGGYKGYVVKQLEAANIHGQDAINETFAILESLSLKSGASREEVKQKISLVIAGVAARRALPDLPKGQIPTIAKLKTAYQAFKNACVSLQVAAQKIFPTVQKTEEQLKNDFDSSIEQNIGTLHKELEAREKFLSEGEGGIILSGRKIKEAEKELQATAAPGKGDQSQGATTSTAKQTAAQGAAGSKKSFASKKSGEKKTGGTEQPKPHRHVGVPKAASTTSAAKAPEPAVLQQPAQKPPSQAAHTRPVKPPIGTLKLDEKTSYKPLNLRKPLQELGLNQDIVIRVVNQKKPAASNGIYTRSEIEDIYASCCKEQELEASQEAHTPPPSPKKTKNLAGNISTLEDQSQEEFMQNLDKFYIDDNRDADTKSKYIKVKEELFQYIFPQPGDNVKSINDKITETRKNINKTTDENEKSKQMGILFGLKLKLSLIDKKGIFDSETQVYLENAIKQMTPTTPKK